MNHRLWIFFILFSGFSKCEINNKNFIEVKFNDSKIEEEFQKTSSFYKKIYKDFFQLLKQNKFTNLDKIKAIEYIKNKYFKSLDEKTRIFFINIFLMLNRSYMANNELNINFKESLIKETIYEYSLENSVDALSYSMALYTLFDNKKINKQELNLMKSIINYFEITNKNKLKKSTKIIEFKKIVNNNNINTLKKDPVLIEYIDFFIKDMGFSEEEKNFINKNIWSIVNFFNNFYEEDFDYLYGQVGDINKEIKVIGKIIDFQENNILFQDISLENFYFFIKSILNLEIEKENNKFYSWYLENRKEFYHFEIINLKNYKKLRIVCNSLEILLYCLYKEKKIEAAEKELWIEEYKKKLSSIYETNEKKNLKLVNKYLL